jgi:F-type H+-transporting ATPase subunit b
MVLFRQLAILAGLLLLASQAQASSLPQMDPTWYKNQLLWLAISFGVLYLAVARMIAPAIQQVLATRESAIQDAIREAELARREAEETRGDFEAARHDARIRAADIMNRAQAESTREAMDAMRKLDHELARRADHASAVLEDALKKARANIDDASRALSVTMSEKLIADLAVSEDNHTAPTLKLATSR